MSAVGSGTAVINQMTKINLPNRGITRRGDEYPVFMLPMVTYLLIYFMNDRKIKIFMHKTT